MEAIPELRSQWRAAVSSMEPSHSGHSAGISRQWLATRRPREEERKHLLIAEHKSLLQHPVGAATFCKHTWEALSLLRFISGRVSTSWSSEEVKARFLTILEHALAKVMNFGLNCRQVIGPVCFPSRTATFIPLSPFQTWIFPSSEPAGRSRKQDMQDALEMSAEERKNIFFCQNFGNRQVSTS